MDDAYLGGECNGGKTGRGAPGKQPFVVAVETDADLEHPRYDVVLEPVRAFDNTSLLDWCQRRLAPDAEVYSDGLVCFARAVDTRTRYWSAKAAARHAKRAVRAGST